MFHRVFRTTVATLALTAAVTTLVGCPNSPTGDGDGTPDTGSDDAITSLTAGTEAGTDTDTTTDTTSDTTDTTDTTTTSDTTAGGECGNGVLEAGEECDDGNDVPDDGCDNCQLTGGPIECGGQIYACGDTIDNDRDGKVDIDDPECISPCDDDEGTFKTNLPGQNEDCKQDCYFDDNSGAGDDKCEWNLKCDPENPGAEIGCEYDPDFQMCDLMVMEQCLEVCVPLLPNGCDCFGCCEIDGQFVYLDGAECALDNLDACQSCTFHPDCNNPCEPEECELCFGQDPSELPEDCFEPECPDGFDPCLQQADCAEGYFCQTGCCYPVDIE